jgi:hypothetical protein
MSSPKIIAERMSRVFKRPVTEKEIRIKMVEIINPEFLITI